MVNLVSKTYENLGKFAFAANPTHKSHMLSWTSQEMLNTCEDDGQFLSCYDIQGMNSSNIKC